jgi:Zn-dependent metalloprotease
LRKKLALGTIAATTALLATGLQSFAATAQSAPTAQALASSHAQALSFGRAQAAGLAGSLGLGAQEQLKIKDVVVDKDGTRHLRYDRTYAGLPVLGGDLVVHETKTGATSSVTRATTAKLALKTVRPAVSATDAKAQAHTTAEALLKKGVATDEALAAVSKAGKPQSTMVEFYENLAADTPDYLIGEKIDINGDGSPLRYMDKPSKDGGSADYWSSSVKNLDVHYSSGVGNHFFYLLSEGSGAKTINGVSYNSPTYSGTTVTGIGRDKAAAIWYRALTVYFTSSTNYKAARVATLKAAADLYGSSSTQYAAVAAAWTGVNVS